MKKTVLLLLAVFTLASYTKAQKSGILQKDYYGTFSGDQWEEFLGGQNAAVFEAKSNMKLSEYLPFMENLTKDVLKEKSIASAVANSTVMTVPEGVEVYTCNTKGEWKPRTSYTNKKLGIEEKGFVHNVTGIFWLSFQCGNPCASVFKKTQPGPAAGQGGYVYNPPASAGAGNVAGGNTINFSAGSTNNVQELSWNVGYAVYSQGRNDRQNDFIVDASLYKLIQDAKQCCGGGSTASTVNYTAATPNLYVLPAAGGSVAQNTGAANTNSTLTVINKADGWEKVNTIANVANFGVNLYTAIHGQKVLLPNQQISTWNGGYTPNPPVRYFNDGNQITTIGNGTGVYSNGF